jgi:ABC-type lipoprotein export system ATPase subunit
MSHIIKLDSVSKSYNNVEFLNNISLEICKNDFIGIIGKSGSGKSTILNIASLLDAPSSGDVFYFGNSTKNLTENEKCALRKKNGFVFQNHFLLKDFTVYDNISIPCIINNIKNYDKKINDVLKTIDLFDKKHSFPHELSGGQSQRIAIIRALIANPHVVFLDEPTGNLDPTTSNSIFNFIKEYTKENNIACVTVTHNYNYNKYFNKIYELGAK